MINIQSNPSGAFYGSCAVVTGAKGDLGRAISIHLASRGAAVVAVDLPGTDWSTLKRALPPNSSLSTVEADVTDEAHVVRYIRHAADICGRIDILVNSAGAEGPVLPLQCYPLDSFKHVLAVNVTGVFLAMKHVLPLMYTQGAGSVVNLSSVAGLIGSSNMVGYTASKHAVVGLTRAAAVEAGPHGVRVNSVNPGPIESRMLTSIAGGGRDVRQSLTSRVPAGRMGTPEEVASVVAFLASADASFCNGGVYTVDGGRHVT